MKTLHLIRHAKACNGYLSTSDIERPLNDQGKSACAVMAQRIVDAGCSFNHVFCSTANRAQQTITGISQALEEKEVSWIIDDQLYTFDSQEILRWCMKLDGALDDVVIVGHNPALTEFCNYLGDRYIDNMPTCGYAKLEITSARWKDLREGSAKLSTFLVPRVYL